MRIVIFYEKPGCVTNAKQKAALREAGCSIIERDILSNGMSESELGSFFVNLPVEKWFNMNAPQIKNAEINPKTLDAATAMALLMQNPILIKRPLMIISKRKLCGFNQWFVQRLLKTELSEKVPTYCSHIDTLLNPTEEELCQLKQEQ
ncbi:MAG: arsenate reductase family protein [Sulfurimonas sp.]|nr:arsenate reductase family protein [Sulfurimonas sp.]